MMKKLLIIAIAVYALYSGGARFISNSSELRNGQTNVSVAPDADFSQISEDEWGGQHVGLPILTTPRPEVILRHKGYTVSYNNDLKLPNWVAWTLVPSRFQEHVSRTGDFLPDPDLKGDDRVTTDDYKRSGYDRGHMCPASDNKWDEQAMRESFYMTNICPQHHNLNRGDWKELEEACRDWACQNKALYIVCGPILYNSRHKTIGKEHKVTVPEAFYKVVLSLTPPKAIGFVYKNASGNRPLDAYVNSVDQVERLTGIDFFTALSDSLEAFVEAECELADWPLAGEH